MIKKFEPKTRYEKFCYKILFLLVENSNKTFICGGTARDILLNKKLIDFDIATNLTPQEVKKILSDKFSVDRSISMQYSKFGVVQILFSNNLSIDIATFRTEVYKKASYPDISFTSSYKLDSNRRDFTINSLYISPKTGKVIDCQRGLDDLRKKTIRFIGKPSKRISDDPIRIVRALRFALQLNFKIEKKSWDKIVFYFLCIKLVSKNKIINEINKTSNYQSKKILTDIIFGAKTLDKVQNKFYYK